MRSDEPGRRPRILIADDDAVLLYIMKQIVEQDYQVVGEAKDGQQSIDLAVQLGPDVVLLDISMPVFNGIEAARRIREKVPGVRTIIISNHTSPIYVDEVLNGGAHGYVFKGSAVLQLPHAIAEVLNGRIFRPAYPETSKAHGYGQEKPRER
jgi:DNA-binding NarL/FixJ family response regulator